MNSVVEKLATIEQELAALQPKMAPLGERIAALDQKVTGFARQLTDLVAESAAVKQDIELTGQGLARIQTLVGESKIESEQLAVGQEENLQRYRAMESFVGTLYQLHSQSVEIAQWLGLADQAKAILPVPPSVPATIGDGRVQTADDSVMGQPMPADVHPETIAVPIPEKPSAEPLPEQPANEPDLPLPESIAEPIAESMPEEFPVETLPVEEAPEQPASEPDPPMPPDVILEGIAEPMPEGPSAETLPEQPANEPDLPLPESIDEPISASMPEEFPVETLPVAESLVEALPAEEVPVEEVLEQSVAVPDPPMPPDVILEGIAEPMPEGPPVEETPINELSAAESILSESDFDSVVSDGGGSEPEPLQVPGLPDVAVLPEMETVPSSDTDAERSDEMASHLDVPPLNLAVPDLPEQNESATMDEQDEQEIEAMLAAMGTPVTVGS